MVAPISATFQAFTPCITLTVGKSPLLEPCRALDTLHLKGFCVSLRKRTQFLSKGRRISAQLAPHGLGDRTHLQKCCLQSHASLVCPIWKKRGSLWGSVCMVVENKQNSFFLLGLVKFTKKNVKAHMVPGEAWDTSPSSSTSSNGAGLEKASQESKDILKDRQRLSIPGIRLNDIKSVADVWKRRASLPLVWKNTFVTNLATGPRSLEAAPRTPLLPFTGTFITFFGFILIIGIVLERWFGRFRGGVQVSNSASRQQFGTSMQPQAPTGISAFQERDLRRKESVEWVNMVLGKLWKVYKLGLESWLVGLLQPLIDNLQKPGYVKRVEIKQFFLGDEPLSVRSVERRTSRRVNDLQYQIGLRYTGGARMLLLLKLKLGFLPITIPVGVRGLDVDGELWVKLRLVPSEPYVGTATWSFVSLPKIKLDLAPFGLFNLMAIPFLSTFLTKLLTQDLPQLFVRPNKIVIDFLQGKAVGPVPKDFKGGTLEGNKDFSGELSVTLVDARKLGYVPYGKTDPYVVLILGDQVFRSKKNSQTSVVGPPGGPIWNQDFQLLVIDPKTQRLAVRVRDAFGLTTFTVGRGEVELSTLQDTVPADRVVTLRGGWGPFRKRFAGEVLLRLTYKAYVEDEEDDEKCDRPLSSGFSSREIMESDVKADALSLAQKAASKATESVQAKELISDMFATVLAERPDENFQHGSLTRTVKGDKNEAGRASIVKGIVSKGLENQIIQRKRDETFPESQMVQPDALDNRTIFVWLGLVAGAALLVAISLNFSNWLNP